MRFLGLLTILGNDIHKGPVCGGRAVSETQGRQERTLTRSARTVLRKNDYPSLHTKDIVQGADIGINARLGEGDPEAGHSRRRLCIPTPPSLGQR
jgi:hypothetical protein